MPNPEHDKKMEDLLRSYAGKRREQAGAPFEMAPRVRSRLQQEVRNVFGKTGAAPSPGWGLSLGVWLRLAMGGAAAAVVVLTIWIIVPSRNANREVAKSGAWAYNGGYASADHFDELPTAPAEASVATPMPPLAPPTMAFNPPSGSLAAESRNRPSDSAATATNDGRTVDRTYSSALGGAVATRDGMGAAAGSATSFSEMPAREMSNTDAGTYAAVPPTPDSGRASGEPGFGASRGGRGGGGGFGGGGGGGFGGGGAGGMGGGGGGRGSGRGGRGATVAEAAAARPAPGPSSNLAISPAPVSMAPAGPATQPATAPSAPADRMAVATAAPSASGNRAYQSPIRNLQSSPAFAQQMVRSQASSSQKAQQDQARSIQSPPVEVLASFQIERDGQQVRIVDADGSLYEGQVVEPALLADTAPAGQAGMVAKEIAGGAHGMANLAQRNIAPSNIQAQQNADANAQSNAGGLASNASNNAGVQNTVQNARQPGGAAALLTLENLQQAGVGSGFAFQVSGMNRKLNQNVTVIGSCITVPLQMGAFSNIANMSNQSEASVAANNAVVANSQARRVESGAALSQGLVDNSGGNSRNTQNTQALQNAAPAGQFWRVTGRVQVGPTNRFDLDAAGVLP